FFRSELLTRMSTERLLSFREWRIGQKVGPAIINMEMGVIRRILKRARRWHLIAADLKPLKERRTVGRALALDEKIRLLRVDLKQIISYSQVVKTAALTQTSHRKVGGQHGVSSPER